MGLLVVQAGHSNAQELQPTAEASSESQWGKWAAFDSNLPPGLCRNSASWGPFGAPPYKHAALIPAVSPKRFAWKENFYKMVVFGCC